MKKSKDKLEICKSLAIISSALAFTIAIVKSCVFGTTASCLETAVSVVSHIGGL